MKLQTRADGLGVLAGALLASLLSASLLTASSLTALLAPAPALAAKPAKGEAAAASAAGKGKATKGAAAKPKDGAAGGAAPAGGPAGALLAAARAELQGQPRPVQGPQPLAELLLVGALEGAFTALVHSAYALSATGVALDRGAMNATDAATVARDIATNLDHIGQTWVAIGKDPVIAQSNAAAVAQLVRATTAGIAAARELATWAATPEVKTRAGAFESALEAFRKDVKELASSLRGP